jgi:hypothetical protein
MTPENLLPTHFEALPDISTCYYFPKNRFGTIGDTDGAAFTIARPNDVCWRVLTSPPLAIRHLTEPTGKFPAKGSTHAAKSLAAWGNCSLLGQSRSRALLAIPQECSKIELGVVICRVAILPEMQPVGFPALVATFWPTLPKPNSE